MDKASAYEAGDLRVRVPSKTKLFGSDPFGHFSYFFIRVLYTADMERQVAESSFELLYGEIVRSVVRAAKTQKVLHD